MSAIFARLFHIVLLCLALTTAGSGAAFAQADPTSAEWIALAERSESTLETGRASDRALEQLRSELADFRAGFLTAQGTNQERLDTLEAQIAALGPAPAEGEPAETAEIATRRAELNRQLGRLMAPQRAAEEAYNRANGLIGEIDTTIRGRQTEAFLELGPTPFNPALWGTALSDFVKSLGAFRDEVLSGANPTNGVGVLRQNLPAIVFFMSVALALLVRGRTWVQWLTMRIYSPRHRTGSPAVAFVVSLGQVLAPLLGMLALREALYASGVLGLRGQLLAEALPGVGLLFFGALWLGGQLFPRQDSVETPLPLAEERRREGRLYFGLLGLLTVVQALLQQLSTFDGYDVSTFAVLSFPIFILAGLVLIRLGRILVGYQTDPDDPESNPFYDHILHITGRILIFVGAAGPILAGVGYLTAGRMMIFPTILSVGLLSLLLVLRVVVRDFYALIARRTEAEASEALTPVLVIFLICVASLPIFALIWGTRVTDLWELWAQFREGFALGDTHISPSDFLTFALVFAIGYVMTRLLQGAMRTSILPKTRIDTGGRTAIVAGLGYVGIFLAVVFAITAAGIDLSAIALVAGALSVGIGFGLQNVVSNFVAGIILLIERPISEGDWIEVGGQMGIVKDIAVRATRIETFDRTDVIVPNADFISGVVTNWTRGNLVGRVIVPVGVAYGTDTRQVEGILSEIAAAHPLVVLNPPPSVLFVGFGADSMDFEIRAILRDVNFVMSVKSDMNHQIAEKFGVAGIEIPFPQRTVWLHSADTKSQDGAVQVRTEIKAQPDNDGTDSGSDPSQGDDII